MQLARQHQQQLAPLKSATAMYDLNDSDSQASKPRADKAEHWSMCAVDSRLHPYHSLGVDNEPASLQGIFGNGGEAVTQLSVVGSGEGQQGVPGQAAAGAGRHSPARNHQVGCCLLCGIFPG